MADIDELMRPASPLPEHSVQPGTNGDREEHEEREDLVLENLRQLALMSRQSVLHEGIVETYNMRAEIVAAQKGARMGKRRGTEVVGASPGGDHGPEGVNNPYSNYIAALESKVRTMELQKHRRRSGQRREFQRPGEPVPEEHRRRRPGQRCVFQRPGQPIRVVVRR